MAHLGWLTARPIAHRGLHDERMGVVENMPAAIAAAVAGAYGVEVDLQITADGEAMVHHDDKLGRLTEASGDLRSMSARELRCVPFKATSERMMTLGDLCDLTAGRATLVLELKSRFDGDRQLARRTAAVIATYHGPVAAMSFDAELVAALRHFAPGLARGMVTQRIDRNGALRSPGVGLRRLSATVLGAAAARINFLAHRVEDLPAPGPALLRHVLGMPLLTWTVRNEEDRRRASAHADQMIFEGFRPK